MRIEFRQGIVSHPVIGTTQDFLQYIPSTGKVNLKTSNGDVKVAFAHKQANYLYTEQNDIDNAWSLISSVTQWIYWDINTATGAVTRGVTTLEPVYGTTAPVSPSIGQMWFDTINTTMKEFVGGVWIDKIRVIAAKVQDGFSFQPVSAGVGIYPFAGTQVGIVTPCYAGSILYDEASNQPVKRSDGTFYTTEDQFTVDNTNLHAIRMEALVLNAEAAENMGSFSVVKFSDFDKVSLASYNDTGNATIAIITNPVVQGEVANVVVQGIISNPNWNFGVVGTKLWIGVSGLLSDVDPHSVDPITYPVAKVPVARVVDRHSIIFDQGLGGKGEKGDQGDSFTTLPKATTLNWGITKLSEPPTISTDPIAVGINDPDYIQAVIRTGDNWAHQTHHANNVDFDTYTSNQPPQAGGIGAGGTVTDAIHDLEDNKVNRVGDTMTGFLELHSDPRNPLHAATKAYVDNYSNGLVWRSPIVLANLISNHYTTPPTTTPQYPYMHGDTYLVANGASGHWLGWDRHLVQWNIATSPVLRDGGDPHGGWIDLGTIESNFSYRVRFGMNLYPENEIRMTTSDVAHGGISTPVATILTSNGVESVDGMIAEYDITAETWDFYTPLTGDAVLITDDFNPDTVYVMNQFVFEGEYGVSGSWVRFGGPNSFYPGRNLAMLGNVLNVDVPEIIQTDTNLVFPLTYGISGITAAENPNNSLQTVLNKLFASKAELSPAYGTFNDLVTNVFISNDTYGMIAYVESEQRMYMATASGWKAFQEADAAKPYDIIFSMAGNLIALEYVVGSFVATREIIIPVGIPDSQAFVKVPPSANADFKLRHFDGVNDNLLGTIRFSPGSRQGTFINFSTNATIMPGDVIELVSPVLADPTLQDVAVTIVGCSIEHTNSCGGI